MSLKYSVGAAHVQENAAAFSVELSQDDKAYLENIFSPENVMGSRNFEAAAKYSYDAHKKQAGY